MQYLVDEGAGNLTIFRFARLFKFVRVMRIFRVVAGAVVRGNDGAVVSPVPESEGTVRHSLSDLSVVGRIGCLHPAVLLRF